MLELPVMTEEKVVYLRRHLEWPMQRVEKIGYPIEGVPGSSDSRAEVDI